MSYEVKGVKMHRGHEGEPLAECGLYRDGVKVAIYSDGDWGGESQFWWIDEKAPKVEVKGIGYDGKSFSYMGTPEEALLMAYCAAIPPKPCEWGTKELVYTTPDTFVCKLVDDFENVKRFAKICKTKTMIHVKGQPEGEYRVFKCPFSQRTKEGIINLLAKKGEEIDEFYNEKIGQVAA